MRSAVAAVVAVVVVVALSTADLALAGPSKPQVAIGLNTELLDNGLLSALEPTIQWETSGTVPGVADIEGGLSMKVKDDGDMPTGVWGRIKKSAFGSKFSCRVDSSSPAFDDWGIDLQASRKSTSIQVTGSANIQQDARTVVAEVQSVKLSQSVVAPFVGGRLTVTPRYNVAKKQGALTTSYGLASTYVTVDATLDKQKVSVSQVLEGGRGVIKPSIDTNGILEVQYSRPLAAGSLTANYKHANALGLKYEKGPWVASLVTPAVEKLASSTPEDLKFNIRRVL